MQNGIYYINRLLEKRYIRKYGTSEKSFKIFTICVVIILFITSCIAIKLCKNCKNHHELINMIFCIIFGVLPFIIILLGVYFIFWLCGSKMFNYRKESMILIYDNCLEYVFLHKDDEFRASHTKGSKPRIVYRIQYNNIRNIEYDEKYHILYITGHAENIEYVNYDMKQLKTIWLINRMGLYENIRYPIILALGNDYEKAFVASLKQRAGLML